MHAMRHSVRIVESGDHKIGYIHTWSYSVERYHELFVDTLFGGELNDVDGLLLDIRDGWGGASPEYLNLFHRQMPQLSMKRRGQPWEHFGLGAGLRYFNVNIDVKKSGRKAEFDFEYYGPTIYGVVTF